MDYEEVALAQVAQDCETQRATNGWPHLVRSAVVPDLDKLLVGIATNSHKPVAISLDLTTAKMFHTHIGKLIVMLEAGENKTVNMSAKTRRRLAGGGNPPPGFKGN